MCIHVQESKDACEVLWLPLQLILAFRRQTQVPKRPQRAIIGQHHFWLFPASKIQVPPSKKGCRTFPWMNSTCKTQCVLQSLQDYALKELGVCVGQLWVACLIYPKQELEEHYWINIMTYSNNCLTITWSFNPLLEFKSWEKEMSAQRQRRQQTGAVSDPLPTVCLVSIRAPCGNWPCCGQ